MMARSKRDILNTEKMLERLTELLAQQKPSTGWAMRQSARFGAREDAEALRRISMTLHNWHELECNEDIQRGRIETLRSGREGPKRHFIPDEKSSELYIVRHDGNGEGVRHYRIPDREADARKRLKAIMARYPKLQAYVQTDPRGCALYILKPGDVPEGEKADSFYSRGLAVFK